MTVTEEDGGRLNVFAKEPEIQIIKENPSIQNRSRLFLLGLAIVLISVFGWYLITK